MNLFVVQDGYEGPIVLILWDQAETAYREEDGKNIYLIPSSGTLCVRSFKNFTHGWGTTEAMYEDGSAIPRATVGSFDDKRFAGLLQRWSTTKSDAQGNTERLSDPELLFFIGNSDEMSDYRAMWSAEEPTFKRNFCENG